MRPVQIVFDAQDTERLAMFWAAALADRGYRVPDPPDGAADWPTWLAAQGVPEEQWGAAFALEGDEGQPRLFFQRVPEPKTAKNRLHLDLQVSGGRHVDHGTRTDLVEAAVTRLVAAGATVVARQEALGHLDHVVMTDPEGNEFCVV